METLLAYNSSSDSDENEETGQNSKSRHEENNKKRKTVEIEQGNIASGRTNTTQAREKRLKPFFGSSEVSLYGMTHCRTNNTFESNQTSSGTYKISRYVCRGTSDVFGESYSSASSKTNEKRNLPLVGAKTQCERPNSSISASGGGVKPYIPKREREKLVHSCTSTSLDKPLLEVADSGYISNDINTATNNKALHVCSSNPDYVSRPPKQLHLSLEGHSQGVNCVRWNPIRGHLLLTAAMDHTVCVWDTSGSGTCRKRLTQHTAAVKDSKWSLCGSQVLSCGYDKTSRLLSLETGKEIVKFPHQTYVTCVQFHPTDPALFLSGTFKSVILCWDIRTGKIASTYSAFFGQVQDIAFLPGGHEFISAAEVIKRNSTDKGIMVWDFRSTVVLSNQLYQEAFTCTCLKVHPCESHFVAQSNGDYIALFSTRKPFKLNKFKRYEGHKVSGYHIGCDFSPDGSTICSGSADGHIYFYDYHTSRMMEKLEAHSLPCMDIAYHPTLPHCVASCGWDGGVKVWN